LRGIDVDGVTHGQRRIVTHQMEAALRHLDEHCRVYQYLVKRIVDPFQAPVCAEPVAQEALNRRTAYLNDRRSDLYQLGQYVVLLYEPVSRAKTATRLERIWRRPSDATLFATGCRHKGRSNCWNPSWMMRFQPFIIGPSPWNRSWQISGCIDCRTPTHLASSGSS
jgi:hypothetical protein